MTQSSTPELIAELKDLLRRERATLVPILETIAELDERRAYVELGYDSMWAFLKRECGQSEAMIHYRLTSARMLRRFPQVAEPLRDGRLCMTVLASLAKVLTPESVDQLLAEATGKPTSEVKRIVRRLDPKPVPKDVITEAPRSSEVVAISQPSQRVVAASQPVHTEVLTETLLRVHMTVDQDYIDLLKEMRGELSHKMPAAADFEILKECMRIARKTRMKRKGIVDKPRADRVAGDGAISQSVKRIVETRDQGKCQWRSEDGGVCASTHRVQFHHKQDRGKGGAGSPENIILLCQRHNLFAAEISCGEQKMERHRNRPRDQATERRRARRGRAASTRGAAPIARALCPSSTLPNSGRRTTSHRLPERRCHPGNAR